MFFTYNVEPNTCERIYFSDSYCIDSVLYENVINNIENVEPAIIESFVNEDSFIRMLHNEEGIYCYYTNDFVGISIPVNFAMGSHLEAELPYGLLSMQ